jgi:hypothetical protein
MAVQKHKLQFEKDAERTRIENVALAEIRADQLVQSRAHLNPGVIADYCERMVDGDEFPPLTVVRVDGAYLLVDGFLRLEAAKLANQKTLRCEVREGDLRTALLLSAKANARHGLRRSWDDKRRSVHKLLGDPEWSKWSDREIARRCVVSPSFVGQERDRLRPVTVNVDSERRQFRSKHGTEAVMNITAIGGKKTAQSAPIILTGPSSPSKTSGEVLSLSDFGSPSETSSEVVSLSDIAQDYREQFVAAVREVKKIFAGLPAVTLIRGDAGADVVLAKDLTWVADKAAATARMLLRR